jgi:hypothetical protein
MTAAIGRARSGKKRRRNPDEDDGTSATTDAEKTLEAWRQRDVANGGRLIDEFVFELHSYAQTVFVVSFNRRSHNGPPDLTLEYLMSRARIVFEIRYEEHPQNCKLFSSYRCFVANTLS